MPLEAHIPKKTSFENLFNVLSFVLGNRCTAARKFDIYDVYFSQNCITVLNKENNVKLIALEIF